VSRGCRDAPFTVEHNAVRFSQFVGGIQVAQTAIEVLPKAFAAVQGTEPVHDTAGVRKWLVELLEASGLVDTQNTGDLHTTCAQHDLLTAWQAVFVSEIERLLQRGLLRSYRRTAGRLPVVKGRMLVHRTATENPAHRERVTCEYTVYDTQHELNVVLKLALEHVATNSPSPHLARRAAAALLSFAAVWHTPLTGDRIRRLQTSRKSAYYQRALDLARFLLMSRTPAFASGDVPVTALLFDMNQVFERYVTRRFVRAAKGIPDLNIAVQPSAPFWKQRRIRPDMILEHGSKRIALDTKWKALDKPAPSDADLKQMYVYARFFDCNDTILLYPYLGLSPTSGTFRDDTASCHLQFIKLIDEQVGRVRKDLAADLEEMVGACE